MPDFGLRQNVSVDQEWTRNSARLKSNDSPSMLACHSLMPASQNEL